ncbi:MAG: glycosyltransferase [Candidatus Sericytochromatia bacterium]|nr:glycosyltransferase [Candidatus Sericytochromatia bacterium]
MTSTPPSPDRVALLVPRWPPDAGGLAGAAARLARALSHHVPVRVIIPDPGLPLGRVAGGLEGTLEIWRFGARTWGERQAGFEACLGARPDLGLVHAIYVSETGRPATRAAARLGIPCLVAARGNDLDRDADRPDRGPSVREALAAADAVVGVSRALTARARALGAARRLLTIPNGVSTTRFRPFERDPALLERLGFPAEGAFPVVAFVGQARPKKGLDPMLAAFRLLRTRHPDALLWLMGGLREDGRASWEAFAAAHPEDAAAVRIDAGFDPDDLPPLLALAEVAWLPSLQDGLPNALLEALACGLPTVASAMGGIPDVLAEGPLEALLVPPGNAEALAATTCWLLDQPESWLALSELGRERVEDAFTPEREVQAYLSLYAQLRTR